jgi:hypothetical protein
VNSIQKEFKQSLPKLAANLALALAFGVTSIVLPQVLDGAFTGAGFYAWLVLTIVAGAFLVRTLFSILVIGDKATGLFLRRLGIQERASRTRVLKDFAFIVATLLATAAVFPFLETSGAAGNVLQTGVTIVAIGVILLFVYHVGRTSYQIFQEKANKMADWIIDRPNRETE